MIKTKTKSTDKAKCVNCLEERKKADRSRKYAHELKNIFITISTVINSELESPQQNFSSFSNNTSNIAESGDVSPYLMESKKHRHHLKQNLNSNINNIDSPFYFIKTLCDYGKTLIKEINDMGKDFINNENSVEPFNISKAIDFCVDMFDTKRKYDKAKKNLERFSDINLSYDKVIKSISETGFKMVLINLLTNSYKFTVKGKIIVRAVSMPKEKKIRILVKDSGKGFNMKEFKKNGCFFLYEKNQELNTDGSGLGLTIVNEILTKFNIKLDCISNTEKGGTLFFFDLDDSYPYYDEINPNNYMTDSLNQILKDINSGKKDKEFIKPKDSFNLMDHLIGINKSDLENDNKIENENNNNSNKKINLLNNNSNNNSNNSNKKINNNSNNNSNNSNNNNNSLKINFKIKDKQRFSFMMMNDINSSPKFENKAIKKLVPLIPPNSNDSPQKIDKISHSKNINNNNNSIYPEKKRNKKRESEGTNNEIKTAIINNNNIIATPYKKKIERFYSLEKQLSLKHYSSNIKKDEKSCFLKRVINDNRRNFNKLKTFNYTGSKGNEMSACKNKHFLKKIWEDVSKNIIKIEDDEQELDSEYNQIKKLKKEKNKKNYKKLLDKNFNKSRFYLFNLKRIFKKNEIYIHLSQQKYKSCITEPSSECNSPKGLKTKKSFCVKKDKVYIIICDDEEFVARSARELIINYYIKKGMEPHVYFTPNGIECLYLMYKLIFIENRKIEFILMDFEMPYLNGIKTCNIIKSIKETNVRVFILSGDEPSNCDADGYCNKPLNEIDIINKLDK